MKNEQRQPVITLEQPWYRCKHGTEFRSMSGKKPQRCPRTPSCKDADIEMVVEVDPVFSQRSKPEKNRFEVHSNAD